MAAKLAFYANQNTTSTTDITQSNIDTAAVATTSTQTEKKRAVLAFYVGQTKKDYTKAIKDDIQTIDNSVAALESKTETLESRIDTKVQTVEQTKEPLEKTRIGDYVFKIIN